MQSPIRKSQSIIVHSIGDGPRRPTKSLFVDHGAANWDQQISVQIQASASIPAESIYSRSMHEIEIVI